MNPESIPIVEIIRGRKKKKKREKFFIAVTFSRIERKKGGEIERL